MNNRHRTTLQNRLDALYCNCHVELTLEELRLWYDMKVTKSVWQKIDQEFQNLLRDYHEDIPDYKIEVLLYGEKVFLILSKFKDNNFCHELAKLMQ